MRTIKQLLNMLGACDKSIQKYGNSRAFKSAFISAPWVWGRYVGESIFDSWPDIKAAKAMDYPRLPTQSHHHTVLGYLWQARALSSYQIGQLFCKKANRIKYWPEVRKRLKQLGVTL
jgi:hypothetical protein